jgi:hypothetical protein
MPPDDLSEAEVRGRLRAQPPYVDVYPEESEEVA